MTISALAQFLHFMAGSVSIGMLMYLRSKENNEYDIKWWAYFGILNFLSTIASTLHHSL